MMEGIRIDAKSFPYKTTISIPSSTVCALKRKHFGWIFLVLLAKFGKPFTPQLNQLVSKRFVIEKTSWPYDDLPHSWKRQSLWTTALDQMKTFHLQQNLDITNLYISNLYITNLGRTNVLFTPVIVKYKKKNLVIANILICQSLGPSRFHRTYNSWVQTVHNKQKISSRKS